MPNHFHGVIELSIGDVPEIDNHTVGADFREALSMPRKGIRAMSAQGNHRGLPLRMTGKLNSPRIATKRSEFVTASLRSDLISHTPEIASLRSQ
jgi:hypothetical protein